MGLECRTRRQCAFLTHQSGTTLDCHPDWLRWTTRGVVHAASVLAPPPGVVLQAGVLLCSFRRIRRAVLGDTALAPVAAACA